MTDSALFAKLFDELEVGDSFETRARTITEADLVSFSALTGDWHPQHADATWAAAGPFGERIAHGMLVVSYAVGLAPFDPERVIALRAIKNLSFKRPVAIGDTIRLTGQVETVKEISAEAGLVSFAWKVLNQEGKLTVRASIEALWRRGSVPEASGNGAGDSVPAKS